MTAAASASSAHRGRLARLLVGYDGSESAEAASAFALWLAGRMGAEATLLHVSPDLGRIERAAGSADVLMAAAEQRRAEDAGWRRRLAKLAAYAPEQAAVECEVIWGSAAATLQEQARARKADLLLVGASGAGLRGALLGSVSAQLVEHAPCPVLVFREGQQALPAHVRAIVVGVDGSPASLRAVELARDLAAPLGARLALLSAYEPGIALDIPTEAIEAGLRDQATRWLRTAREHVGSEVAVTESIAEGPARKELLAACERHGPALVAVGSRGLGGFAGLLLGSTSRWLLHHAPCPVLVARAPEET